MGTLINARKEIEKEPAAQSLYQPIGKSEFIGYNEVDIAGFGKHQSYFAIGIQIFAAIQIIKSTTRGLLLPFLALMLGGTIAHNLSADQTLLHFNKTFYEPLMITGIIGLTEL